ncbi:methyltransferase domain-containing protein [Candidatus Woesearchaeota archaeon]|nr:methyltransferase domain-containing protein [Candidatus Woesearchaeota archaeon]
MKVLTDKKKTYLVKDSTKDFHCKDGMIKSADFKKGVVKTNTKKEFFCFDSTKKDEYENIKRGAQIMVPKDLGFILSNTMVDKNSIVFDCGSGSGAAACFFANYAKKVYSFDNREDHIKILKENAEKLGLKNVTAKKLDIYVDKISVKEKGDLFVLDVPSPEKALPNVDKTLKIGGFLASYNPCITQNNTLVNALPENYMHVKTVEVIEREWNAEGRSVRPVTKDFQHTGFITLARKIN